MSVFYPKQLMYLADLSRALEKAELPLEDQDGMYGVKILIVDKTQDLPIGHVTTDEEGSLRVELDDNLL